jgi:radial spoke head protein 9
MLPTCITCASHNHQIAVLFFLHCPGSYPPLPAQQSYFIANAHNQVVPNRLFSGLDYPDKLESYVHRSSALEEGKAGGLAGDVRGSWSLQYDSFKGVAVLRSLLFPGYCFYYSSRDMTWGSLYVGDGMQNNDLVFML